MSYICGMTLCQVVCWHVKTIIIYYLQGCVYFSIRMVVHFGGTITFADRWPNYECDETQKHPTDPDCCRCINHKWNCLLYRWFNCRRVNCPESRQVKVPGKCCPVCLEANMPSPDSVPSVESNPARAPLIADDSE